MSYFVIIIIIIIIIILVDIHKELKEEFLKIQRDFKKKRQLTQNNKFGNTRTVARMIIHNQLSTPYKFGKHISTEI